MSEHLFNTFTQMISYLNLGQTAVAGFDQPLYATAKRTLASIKWEVCPHALSIAH